VGCSALIGLTLLECGVPANDPVLQTHLQTVRAGSPQLQATYEIAVAVWFLDRLGAAEDRSLLRALVLRLIANQGRGGGWGYSCFLLSSDDEQTLLKLLAQHKLAVLARSDAPSPGAMPDNPFALLFFGPAAPDRPANLNDLPVFRFRPGEKLEYRPQSHEDNSLTQFAVLALWKGRQHDIPVERSLAFVDTRFRTSQNRDGSWGYTLNTSQRRDSMTCAGLLALAVARGLGQVEGDRTAPPRELKDEVVEKGLVFLGSVVGKPGLNAPDPQATAKRQAEAAKLQEESNRLTKEQAQKLKELRAARTVFERQKLLQQFNELQQQQVQVRQQFLQLQQSAAFRFGQGKIIGAEALGDLYFLWSLERMAVIYDLKTVNGKDWYAWGSKLIVNAQNPDGSWSDTWPGVPDTCFALLFLKRVNVVRDLTERLLLLGKVKDPADQKLHFRPPGEESPPER